MIESFPLPAFDRMALFTACAKPALVFVILAVAGDTFGDKPLIDFIDVAGLAFDAFMAAQQGITGFGMVKMHGFPICHHMAGLAVLAEPPFVWLILFVTGQAV